MLTPAIGAGLADAVHPPARPPRAVGGRARRGSVRGWVGPRAFPAALLVLTMAACLVRSGGVPSVQGTLARDEARLALAARGIVEHGLPLLPDGFLYTRGLLPAYLEAALVATIGTADQAVRLPSLVAGTLLVPAVYQLGRGAGGPGVGLTAAAIVAFSQPLVLQAREAWLYSSFLLWFVLALSWLQRGRAGDRLRAGLAFVAALLSHEFAVLLLPIAALRDLLGPRSSRAPVDRRELVAFWTLAATAVVLVGGLALAMRAPTAGGATVEIREYLRPSLDLGGLVSTLGILGGWHAWLVPAAALGVPLSGRGVERRPLLVYLALAVVLAFDSLLLVNRGESRYVLMALPLLVIAAAHGAGRVGPGVLIALAGWRPSRRQRTRLGTALLVGLSVASFDPVRLRADVVARDVPSTWVQALADRAPDDLVMSFAPTLTTHYLGRTDFWLRTAGYHKYVWAGDPPLRDVHSGALVVRSVRELEELVIAPHRGRTLWVVLDGDPAAERSRPVREILAGLDAYAPEQRSSPDGRVVLRISL
jgi:hypothetical protein